MVGIFRSIRIKNADYTKGLVSLREKRKNARTIEKKWFYRQKIRKYKKEYWNSSADPGWNLYGAKSRSEFNKKFHFLHYVLKYKIVVPLLRIAKVWIEKRLGEFSIPNQSYNKDLIIFDTAYEEAKQDWFLYWHCAGNEELAEARREKFQNNFGLMDTVIKDGYLRLALGDSAYREFHSILMHKIALGMLDEYKGRNVRHLFYSADHVYDVDWYLMTSYLEKADIKLNTPKGEIYAKRISER